MQIYSPEGRIGQASVQKATSPSTLASLRIAVLDNGKPGTQVILERVAERLSERTQAQFVGHFRKRTAATPCEQELLTRIAQEADVVLTGTAD